ncbi:4Fe-4S binding protein [Chloroflexota bacterium]
MQLKGWKEIPIGGLILNAGNSEEYDTGSWRSSRPVIDTERCRHCMNCWIYCPEGAIQVANEEIVGVDLDHCKGCGICAQECPLKAIGMSKEPLADAAVFGGDLETRKGKR